LVALSVRGSTRITPRNGDLPSEQYNPDQIAQTDDLHKLGQEFCAARPAALCTAIGYGNEVELRQDLY